MTLALNDEGIARCDLLGELVSEARSPVPASRLFDSPRDIDLVSALLAEQSDLTAVQRFSRLHEGSRLTRGEYSSLLPASPPAPGQQYGFEVNLDACSGCKACVTACHSLNGLDDGETWRDVGLLHGGTSNQPVVQHVTTACHHCLDPACANACPVNAYEKDSATGIVRHLDDQCIGCQYCTLACPYDVPKFHARLGIVRKCDLCQGRLAAGEPPACAQACPHAAIRVQIVNIRQVIEDSEVCSFLPGAPDSDYTLPTTVFRTERVLPRNLIPADYYDVKPEHAHWPLVAMLVLTQLSVGGFVCEFLLRVAQTEHRHLALHSAISAGFGLLALAASTLHLGRPHLAFRSILGVRHSWLSREAIAFGLFAPAAIVHSALAYQQAERLAASVLVVAGVFVCLTGVAGVGCGVMVYHVVRRPFWHAGRTATKFIGTSTILGLATTWLTSSVALARFTDGRPASSTQMTDTICILLIACATAKLLFEAADLRHLLDRRYTPLRRTAELMISALQRVTLVRFSLGTIGGILLPLICLSAGSESPALLNTIGATTAFAAIVGGELAERYLFFTAVVRQKMPGGLAV